MANNGSAIASMCIVNEVTALMQIREGQIKNFVYDAVNEAWVNKKFVEVTDAFGQHSNLRDAAGDEVGTLANPLVVNTSGSVPFTLQTETGVSNIAYFYSPAAKFLLTAVSCKLSAVPTSAGSFVIRLVSAEGSNYDVTLYTRDLSVDESADLYYIPQTAIPFGSGDSISITYPNTDALTYGLRVIVS